MNLFNNGDVEFNMSEVFLKSCIHLAHVNRCQSLRQFSYEFILRKIALHDAVMKCRHNTWLFWKARTFLVTILRSEEPRKQCGLKIGKIVG